MTFETNQPYVQKVYGTLKKAIITNELKQGQILNEREISDILCISRTPLRDGLNLLEKDGFIVKSGKARIVSSLTWKDIEEVYELRLLIESYAVRNSAINITVDQAKKSMEMLDRMDTTFHNSSDAGILDFLSLDQEWHLYIDQFCANNKLSQVLNSLYDQFVRISYITTTDESGRIHESITEHRQIGNALCERNPELAEKYFINHINAWHDSLMKNWEGDK